MDAKISGLAFTIVLRLEVLGSIKPQLSGPNHQSYISTLGFVARDLWQQIVGISLDLVSELMVQIQQILVNCILQQNLCPHAAYVLEGDRQ